MYSDFMRFTRVTVVTRRVGKFNNNLVCPVLCRVQGFPFAFQYQWFGSDETVGSVVSADDQLYVSVEGDFQYPVGRITGGKEVNPVKFCMFTGCTLCIVTAMLIAVIWQFEPGLSVLVVETDVFAVVAGAGSISCAW